MIEVLVDYIEKKGFFVKVFKGYIVICKYLGEYSMEFGWALAPHELSGSIPRDVLFDQADYYMGYIKDAIEKGPPEDEG
jgi:hypothetical protein